MSVFTRLYIHSPWSLDIANQTSMWAMLSNKALSIVWLLLLPRVNSIERLWYRSRSLIFINIRPLVVHPPYYLSSDCSYIPMYEIYSWKRFIYDRKIAVIILCIGSTFGNIYSKYAIVYCGYRFSFNYVCSSAIVYMCDFGVKTSIIMVRYLYKMILIT